MNSVSRRVMAIVGAIGIALWLLPSRIVAQGSTVKSPAALSAADVFRDSNGAIAMISTAEGFGSGVVIDTSGLVVTNLHVLGKSGSVQVKLPSGDLYDDVRVI